MTIRYGPTAAWLARATADALLHGDYQAHTVSGGIFANPRGVLDGGVTHRQLARQSVVRGNDEPTKRPLVLDWMTEWDGDERDVLDGIALSQAAVQWLVEQRFLPAIYVPAIFVDDFNGDVLADPNFLFWRENVYIAPPKQCPVQRPATARGSIFGKIKSYTAAERLEAHRLIDARLDLDSRSKAAHKAHVSRRTVTA